MVFFSCKQCGKKQAKIVIHREANTETINADVENGELKPRTFPDLGVKEEEKEIKPVGVNPNDKDKAIVEIDSNKKELFDIPSQSKEGVPSFQQSERDNRITKSCYETTVDQWHQSNVLMKEHQELMMHMPLLRVLDAAGLSLLEPVFADLGYFTVGDCDEALSDHVLRSKLGISRQSIHAFRAALAGVRMNIGGYRNTAVTKEKRHASEDDVLKLALDFTERVSGGDETLLESEEDEDEDDEEDEDDSFDDDKIMESSQSMGAESAGLTSPPVPTVKATWRDIPLASAVAMTSIDVTPPPPPPPPPNKPPHSRRIIRKEPMAPRGNHVTTNGLASPPHNPMRRPSSSPRASPSSNKSHAGKGSPKKTTRDRVTSGAVYSF
jgi:hypothetical protein